MIFTTRIPTHFNDGSKISRRRIRQILVDVRTMFGGYTFTGPDEGAWQDDAGRVFEETSYCLEVACDRGRYSDARQFVVDSGRKLQQKAMYFEVRYFDGIEIIDV